MKVCTKRRQTDKATASFTTCLTSRARTRIVGDIDPRRLFRVSDTVKAPSRSPFLSAIKATAKAEAETKETLQFERKPGLWRTNLGLDVPDLARSLVLLDSLYRGQGHSGKSKQTGCKRNITSMVICESEGYL